MRWSAASSASFPCGWGFLGFPARVLAGSCKFGLYTRRISPICLQTRRENLPKLHDDPKLEPPKALSHLALCSHSFEMLGPSWRRGASSTKIRRTAHARSLGIGPFRLPPKSVRSEYVALDAGWVCGGCLNNPFLRSPYDSLQVLELTTASSRRPQAAQALNPPPPKAVKKVA